MSDILGLFILLVVGPGFLSLGIWSLRRKAWRETVPLAELVIDRAFGIDPPPRNKWDMRFARLQAWFFTIFGALVSFGVLAVFITDNISE